MDEVEIPFSVLEKVVIVVLVKVVPVFGWFAVVEMLIFFGNGCILLFLERSGNRSVLIRRGWDVVPRIFREDLGLIREESA